MKKSEAMNLQAIIRSATRFTTPGNARYHINNRESPSKWSIILGDDGYLWVVTNRQASILVKHGYELAP